MLWRCPAGWKKSVFGLLMFNASLRCYPWRLFLLFYSFLISPFFLIDYRGAWRFGVVFVFQLICFLALSFSLSSFMEAFYLSSPYHLENFMKQYLLERVAALSHESPSEDEMMSRKENKKIAQLFSINEWNDIDMGQCLQSHATFFLLREISSFKEEIE